MVADEFCEDPALIQLQVEVAQRSTLLDLLSLGDVSKYLVGFTYACLVLASVFLLTFGLPTKPPQHDSVQRRCPTSWVVFLGTIYTFTYFTTDQYVPSLPQMEVDLSATQSLMSLTVQMNFIVKALFGMLTAGLSDRIGRRPTLVWCMLLLSLASFCCACATRIEWFFGARILQGIGESVEPVVFAVVRDHFPNPKERFGIVTALQVMSIGGMLVAPCVGGLLAQLTGWRTSFFLLALLWALLGLYAWAFMVESCPDGDRHGYLEGLSRILDPHLLCLLLTQSCIMGACLSFNANSSYFTEVTLGQPIMISAYVMLAFGACNSLGAFVTQTCCTGSILRVSRISVTLLSSAGLTSVVLQMVFPEFLWGYLLGSFLQASVMTMALVSVNVLFFEPLEDCAGIAASCEIFAKSVVPSLFSMACTQALIHRGPRSFIDLQGGACVAAAVIFWLGYGWSPPHWAQTRAEFEEPSKPRG